MRLGVRRRCSRGGDGRQPRARIADVCFRRRAVAAYILLLLLLLLLVLRNRFQILLYASRARFCARVRRGRSGERRQAAMTNTERSGGVRVLFASPLGIKLFGKNLLSFLQTAQVDNLLALQLFLINLLAIKVGVNKQF